MDRYLANSPFKAEAVFHKGQTPPKDNPKRQARPDSGFVVLISEDQATDFQKVLTFLFLHEKEWDRLRALGVDNMLLDFGMGVSSKIQQSEYLPPELIVALARFKMGVIFSAVQIPHD